MLFVACWYGLLCAPLVRADGWDDFSNNLATDLAPLLSLFGEQITKQYLSESISKLDYFIFAMAPMGIMTAVVSAIRVCGSPSLRAFIGRAQEGAGNAEVELCSSTSRDVCELYNNGGIARVFGRPKVLEIVYNPAESDFDKTAGIYTFREYLNSENGQKEWECVQKDNQDLEKNYKHSAFAPNLSLNVGIKKQPPLVFWAVALAGFVLQAGVLVFAVIATYYLQWNKDSSRPESYACPLAIIGTLLVCGGNFLCAFLVGQSTQELVYRKREIIGKNSQMPSSIYWVQPGGQSLGDQIFDPFCYNDRARPLNEYTTSWKNQSDGWTKKSEMVVWIAVSATTSGFIMQFVGLRGIHSAISVAQLGAIIVMSAARAALRMQRLKPDDNFLSNCPDEVVGHELDWLALRIGDQYVSVAFPSTSSLPRRCFWKFCGSLDNLAISKSQCQPAAENLQVASNILAYRTRLARLTYAPISQTKVLGSAECFTAGMVEVRESARRLALAIELVTNTVYSLSHEIHKDWKNALSIPWEIVCDVTKSPSMGPESKTYTAGSQVRPGLRLELIRESQESPWKFKDKMGIEGLLGLWVWSLKSDPAVEISDSQSGLTLSRSSEISVRRIVTVNRDFAEVDLKVWSDGVIPRITLDKLHPRSTRDADANMLWKRDRALSGCYKPFLEKLPVESDGIVRFIGWHTTVMLQGQGPNPFNVWSAPTQSSLLSICAQEVFGSFLKCILSVVSNIGSIEIQQEAPSFRLRNDLVSALTNNFTESRLGPREEALLCVLPPVVSQLSLSSTKGALEAAKRNAHHHRRHGRWQEADAILRWALRVETATNNSHSEAALIALGELYRWALRHDATKSFGFEGIEWLAKSDHKQPLTAVVNTVVKRYSDLARKIDHPKNHDRPGIFLRAMRGNLCEALLYLTLPDPISNRQKSQLLYSAAIHNWIEVAFALLELGADTGFKDPHSRTALFRAAENGGIEMLKVLMNGGAFPNSADTNQRAPISYASEKGHGNIVAELLSDERVDPDAKDKYGRTPLLWAVRNRHETIVKMLLDTDKVDLDAKDNSGRTPLYWAVENRHETIVKTLLDTDKVDLDAKDNDGQTPLLWAVRNGHETIVKTLLDTGKVDLDAKDNYGRTPLYWAAENGHETIVKMLLDTGKVDPDLKDNYGQTPLLWAVRNGHKTIVKTLLDTGKVDLDAKDNYGRTPLYWAAENGHETIVKMLLDTGKVDPDTKDNDGRTLLLWAAENGHETIVKMLLDTGKVDLDAKDKYGQTPLLWAAENGHETIVKTLLDTGKVDPDDKDKYGRTPLLWAVRNRHETIVKTLLDTDKVDLDAKDNSGRTPLYWAVENGHETIVKTLLDTGKVNLDAKDNDGQTPLLWAVENGYKTIVKMLLDTGKVDPDLKDNDGQTPLLWAAENGYKTIVKMLLDTGKVDPGLKDNDGQTPLLWAAENRHETIVKTLLDTGKVDLDTKDNDGQTPLLWAVRNRHETIVKTLLDTDKVDLDAKDNDGRTPLLWAVRNGHETIVKTLLDTGKVDLDAKDNDGRTPLSWAVRNRHETIVKMLLDTGKVDPDLKDNDGQTPLLWAAENGHETIVKMLLDTGKVDLDTKDNYGRTPLLWAAEKGHGNIVAELLSDERVDPDAKDKYGRTPLLWAVRNRHETIVKMLLDTGKVDLDTKDNDGRTPLYWAAGNGYETIVKMLFDTGKVDLDAKDKDGRTPLLWAAVNGHKTIVKTLLDTGKVDPDAKDNDGRIPLYWAVRNGYKTIVKMLFDTGKVDLDAKDKDGQTPLLWAAENGHETIVKTLLDTGKVDLDAKDNYGRTPLLWAAENGHETIVKMLLDTGKVDPDEVFNLLADTMRSEEQHIATNRMVTKATLVVHIS